MCMCGESGDAQYVGWDSLERVTMTELGMPLVVEMVVDVSR